MALASEHKGKGDVRWMIQPPASRILNGHEWDGSDFVGGGDPAIVTRRVIDWLLAAHSGPFLAKPCRVDVSKMNADQQRWLKRAVKPLN